MPKLRIFSGKELVKIFLKQGFFIERTKGSHVVLKNSKGDFIFLPLHKQIDRGTLGSILKITEKYFSKEFIKNTFYR